MIDWVGRKRPLRHDHCPPLMLLHRIYNKCKHYIHNTLRLGACSRKNRDAAASIFTPIQNAPSYFARITRDASKRNNSDTSPATPAEISRNLSTSTTTLFSYSLCTITSHVASLPQRAVKTRKPYLREVILTSRLFLTVDAGGSEFPPPLSKLAFTTSMRTSRHRSVQIVQKSGIPLRK